MRGTYFNLISFIVTTEQLGERRAVIQFSLYEGKLGDLAEILRHLAGTRDVTSHTRLGERQQGAGSVYELMHVTSVTGVATRQNGVLGRNKVRHAGKKLVI